MQSSITGEVVYVSKSRGLAIIALDPNGDAILLPMDLLPAEIEVTQVAEITVTLRDE